MPERRDSYGPLYLAVRGRRVPQYMCLKYSVQTMVKLLAGFGYIIPSYSSMIVQAMQHQGLFYDVEEYCLFLAQNNIRNVVSFM